MSPSISPQTPGGRWGRGTVHWRESIHSLSCFILTLENLIVWTRIRLNKSTFSLRAGRNTRVKRSYKFIKIHQRKYFSLHINNWRSLKCVNRVCVHFYDHLTGKKPRLCDTEWFKATCPPQIRPWVHFMSKDLAGHFYKEAAHFQRGQKDKRWGQPTYFSYLFFSLVLSVLKKIFWHWIIFLFILYKCL